MKYFGQFTDRLDVAREFEEGTGHRWDDNTFLPAESFPTDEEILIASYGSGSDDGDAFVLFERDGTLFEVHGSHCSCYGLEGQWKPEETSWAAIDMRRSEHPNEALVALVAIVSAHLGRRC